MLMCTASSAHVHVQPRWCNIEFGGRGGIISSIYGLLSGHLSYLMQRHFFPSTYPELPNDASETLKQAADDPILALSPVGELSRI